MLNVEGERVVDVHCSRITMVLPNTDFILNKIPLSGATVSTLLHGVVKSHHKSQIWNRTYNHLPKPDTLFSHFKPRRTLDSAQHLR